MTEEAKKEHKKMLDKLSHQADDMKGSYMKLMTEVQSSSSHGTTAMEQRHLSSELYFISVLNSRYYELTMVWYMSP